MLLILHVGTHKTGTTALQNYLRTNQQTFLDNGILIPLQGNHHNIAWELNNDPRFRSSRETLTDLCAELGESDCHTAIVSSEDFEYLYAIPEAMETLKRRLNNAGCQVEVILFFRGVEEYFPSLHNELLKHGVDVPIDELKEQEEVTIKGRWRFCFNRDKLVWSFARIFGNNHVHHFNYEFPIEPTFLKVCGLSHLEPLMQEVPAANARKSE